MEAPETLLTDRQHLLPGCLDTRPSEDEPDPMGRKERAEPDRLRAQRQADFAVRRLLEETREPSSLPLPPLTYLAIAVLTRPT